MSGVSSAMTAVKDKYYGALATASVSYFALTTWAFAQGADPKAPLDFQKQAQSAAASSRLNPDDAQSGLNNVGSTFLYAGSALSIMFALYSLYKWWDAVNNEQSRHSAGGSFMAACIAGVIGIVGIFVGWVQSVALGGGS
ncbi:hypothetical protein HW571_26645 [Agrobacterium genomosp. 3]|uniref:DUF4134 domain-containing protein n=1 Tax=Rhizobium oryzihabitans TaxID=2267833 RepID=A0A7L5BS36_9HYPH|nr:MULTISPECIES: hypothetical protein [Rhizobiaceae]MCA1869201.1 hypothetical protein [Agrobacterium tomkonis]MCA1879589.1 hypothetical protein [Agrobacterium tumefaciens]MCT6836379.1 hypothetical protein [Bifidobacteriales bacterium]MDH0912724.1 hypothetical protein [Agrobacterium pusense]MCA1894807.1 hypothetical protein [Agrobacterium tomkonis]